MTVTPSPRIYVACLSCYNGGKLHGEWFDLEGLDADDLHTEMVKAFKLDAKGFAPCTGEGFLVHDHEGFLGYRVGEVSPSEAISAAKFITRATEEHSMGAARAALSLADDLDQAREMLDCYHGEWDSVKDYAEDRHTLVRIGSGYSAKVYELGDVRFAGGTIGTFIDWAAVARVMEHDGLRSYTDPDTYNLHIFS